jgi:hypothetical protein
MDTAVALVSAYLRFNGYVAAPEQPIFIGEGRPYRYHTATDIDVIALRFPRAAVVVPRDGGRPYDEDLNLDVDPRLGLSPETVDVIIGEVKEGKPRLNGALRDPDVLYATLRRVDAGFDEPIRETIKTLIRAGQASVEAGGRRWRFRLAAFGQGEPVREGGPFTVFQLREVALFLMETMRQHRDVWRDAQFGEPVLDLLHLFDKLDLAMVPAREARSEARLAELGASAAAPAPETVLRDGPPEAVLDAVPQTEPARPLAPPEATAPLVRVVRE